MLSLKKFVLRLLAWIIFLVPVGYVGAMAPMLRRTTMQRRFRSVGFPPMLLICCLPYLLATQCAVNPENLFSIVGIYNRTGEALTVTPLGADAATPESLANGDLILFEIQQQLEPFVFQLSQQGSSENVDVLIFESMGFPISRLLTITSIGSDQGTEIYRSYMFPINAFADPTSNNRSVCGSSTLFMLINTSDFDIAASDSSHGVVLSPLDEWVIQLERGASIEVRFSAKDGKNEITTTHTLLAPKKGTQIISNAIFVNVESGSFVIEKREAMFRRLSPDACQ